MKNAANSNEIAAVLFSFSLISLVGPDIAPSSIVAPSSVVTSTIVTTVLLKTLTVALNKRVAEHLSVLSLVSVGRAVVPIPPVMRSLRVIILAALGIGCASAYADLITAFTSNLVGVVIAIVSSVAIVSISVVSIIAIVTISTILIIAISTILAIPSGILRLGCTACHSGDTKKHKNC